LSAARLSARLALPVVLMVAVLAAGCGHAKSPADAVASWRGGSLSLADVQTALRLQDSGAAQLPADAVVDRLRETAEDMVLQRVLLADLDPQAEAERLGAELDPARRQAVIDLFLADRLGAGRLTISGEEVAAYYRDHRQRFRSPSRRNLWHIFRRYRRGETRQQTVALLSSLRERAEAGESFSELARRYSDSETHAIGGHLGWIEPGRLPKALDHLVFALEPGRVSRPVELSSGAAIFLVTEALEALDPSLEDVRREIAQVLAEDKRAEVLTKLVGDRPLPAGTKVLEASELSGALDGAPGEQPVLELRDFRLTAAQLRELATADRQAHPVLWRTDPEGRVARVYRRQLLDQRVYLEAVASGFADRPETRKAVDRRLQPTIRRRAFADRLEQRMGQRLDALSGAGELRRFYDDNHFLYQTPVRLKMWTLSVPVDEAELRAGALSARLAAARPALEKGDLDLRALAGELGGEVVDNGWVAFADLQTIEPKVRHYLLALDGPGYTAPFHLDGRLHMVWVEERQEPRVLPFAEVADRVRSDYRERHKQEIFHHISDQVLTEAGFRFYREAAARGLQTRAGEGSAGEPPRPAPQPAAPAGS
jgi:PPIC-type PPIASE domain